MEVHNDPLQLFLSKKQNGRQKTKWPPKTKLSITHSIFELEDPDFTWKFTMTLSNYFYPKNKMATKKTKWPPKTKLSITQSIFKLEVPDFAW